MKNEEIAELVKAERDVARFRDKATLAERKYKVLQKDYLFLKREHEAVQELHSLPNKRHHMVARKGKGGDAVPLIYLSDWHVEEEIRASSVSGWNKFNLEIAEKRAKRCFERIYRLIRKEQQDINIKKAVIVFGGDFISSNIHEELLASCLLRPVDAVRFAEDLLTSGIMFLLENTSLDLVIPCKCGNHSRITRKVHISGEMGNSLESAMYYSMRKRFENEPRVTFIIEDSYLTHLKIFNKIIRIHHGHAVRFGGGIGGLHIPLRKAIGEWNKTKPADFDMLGHFHQFSNTTPMYATNGSLIGYSPFAVFIKAVYEPPIQNLTMLDAKRGITGQFPILCE